MSRLSKKALGDRGELAAKIYLESLDYQILECKWRSGHGSGSGEADIIAMDRDELVFVEVKTRMSDTNMQPTDAVDKRKRAKYINIATQYIIQNKLSGCNARFDVVSILMIGPSRASLNHFQNAYFADQIA